MKTRLSITNLLSHKIITYAITLIFYPLHSLYVFSIRWKIVQSTYQGYHQMQWIVLCTLHRYWPKKKNCCPIKTSIDDLYLILVFLLLLSVSKDDYHFYFELDKSAYTILCKSCLIFMRHIQAIFSFIFNYKRTSRKEILGKVFHNIVVFNTRSDKRRISIP